MQGIRVNVSYGGKNKQIVILSASGYMDITTAGEIEKKLERLLIHQSRKVVLNLKNIEYISIAGWGVLLWAMSEIRQHHGELVLVNMSPRVHSVYEKLGLRGILRSFHCIDEAVTNLTKREADKTVVHPWRNRFLREESVKRETTAV